MRRSSIEDAECDHKNQSTFGLSNVNIEQKVIRAPLGRNLHRNRRSMDEVCNDSTVGGCDASMSLEVSLNIGFKIFPREDPSSLLIYYPVLLLLLLLLEYYCYDYCYDYYC